MPIEQQLRAHVIAPATEREQLSAVTASYVTAAAFSPDGDRVITASEDHTARVWDARTGKPSPSPSRRSID